MAKEQESTSYSEQRCWRFPETRDGSLVSGASVLKQIMSHIQPDGGVKMHQGKTWYAEPVDLSQMSLEEREELQMDLAKMLYDHVKRVWMIGCGDKVEAKINEKIEPHLAFDLSGFHHDPELLEGAAQIVDEKMAERDQYHHPTKYPRLY